MIRTILYLGSMAEGQSSRRRADLFASLGVDVARVDVSRHLNAGFLHKQQAVRLQTGPVIDAINHEIIQRLDEKPDAVFLDKPIFVRPETVALMNARGVRTLSYMPDDPFGPRKDGVWRLFLQSLPLYDLHVVPRQVSASDFRAAGAKDVIVRDFSFDPSVHIPDPSRSTFSYDVSFIGSPYDDRPEFLWRLKEQLNGAGVNLSIMGPQWHSWRYARHGRRLGAQPAVWGPKYGEAIRSSKASLAFVTRSNRDEISHKAIEIAACGRAAIIDNHGRHPEIFEDGISALIFNDVDDCAQKIIAAWRSPNMLDEIGRNAAIRVRELGLSERDFVIQALKRLEGIQ
jgi:glycosyltransferase involved in cell wall biosynthesis